MSPKRRNNVTTGSESGDNYLDSLSRSQIQDITRAFEIAASKSHSRTEPDSDPGRVLNAHAPAEDIAAEAGTERGFFNDDIEDGVGGGFVTDDVSARGFLLPQADDEEMDGAGGFLPTQGGGIAYESETEGGFHPKSGDARDNTDVSRLPLSFLSYALSLLPPSIRLPYPANDPHLLQVFKDVSETSGGEEWIGKEAFLKFCAAFVESGVSSSGEEQNEETMDPERSDVMEEGRGGRKRKPVSYREVDSSDDGDAYQEEEEVDSDSGEAEDGGGGFVPEKRKTRSSGPIELENLSYFSVDEDQDEDEFTASMSAKKGKKGRGKYRTEEELRSASDKVFDMFFLDGPKGERLGFADLKRVADALGEKLSDQDINEMLELAGKDYHGRVGRKEFVDVFRKI
ncbi:hypothetical protein BT69DRAFT_1294769 [Atractiella rhizophila]|nr:hypothetical protein BT69DRAFT_1294769 [Atractiella rhizophila]